MNWNEWAQLYERSIQVRTVLVIGRKSMSFPHIIGHYKRGGQTSKLLEALIHLWFKICNKAIVYPNFPNFRSSQAVEIQLKNEDVSVTRAGIKRCAI